VLITGDITDSGTTGEFKKARNFLDKLAKTNPILMVPGNHDYAWKGIVWHKDKWKDWLKYLGTPLGWASPPTSWLEPTHEPEGVDGLGVWKDGSIVFVGVDSGDPKDHEKTARGWISPQLAAGLSATLDKYQGYIRIVLVHHHPFMHGGHMKMVGADRFRNAARGNCELLLFGHKHDYGLWKLKDEIPLTVASHKTSNKLIDREYSAITVIEINDAGELHFGLDHKLDLVV
jgi:3',5'-cyclic AMP phosphodiesterase CpdA